MKRKILMIVACLFMVVMASCPLESESFAGREAEMNKKCAYITDKATQQECIAYKEYLQQKSKNLSSEIDGIKKQLSNVKGSMESIGEKLRSNHKQVAKINAEMASVENAIAKTEASIAKMNVKIKEKTEDIQERDKMMRERLIEMQPYIGSNNFIDFLMGADSFADLLRRSEILGQLNSYESDQIKTLNKEKAKLKEDKEVVQQQKELLKVQEQGLKDQKEKAEAIKEVNEKLMSAYRKQEEQLLDQKIKTQMAQMSIPKVDTSLAAQFDDETSDKPDKDKNDGSNDHNGDSQDNNQGNNGNGNGNGVKPSTGFITPIQGNWHYSAGTWAYADGSVHRGMDFGTYQAQGLRVVAPASGIVIWTYGGCPSPSGDNFGSYCGVPATAGNNLTMLTRVDGVVYAFSFYHLSGTAVSSGTAVAQGQTIAYTGNSGNSTGPHCHVEMIRVGNMSLSDALNKFNNSGDLSFGVGWYADPHACSSYGSPCRLRPENYFL